MSKDRADHSTVSEKAEPPSRHIQYLLIESLTVAVVDGNISSFLSVLCGSIHSPFVILFAGYGFISLVALWYGLPGITCIVDHLSVNGQQGLPILALIALQGIGYFLAELLHRKITRHLKKSGYVDSIALALLKNVFLGLVVLLLYVSTRSAGIVNFAYGALYALSTRAIQDMIYQTPFLKHLVVLLTRTILNLVEVVQKKIFYHKTGLLYILCILYFCVGLINSTLYASCHSSVQNLASIQFFLVFLGFLEQAVVYEYAYRATYVLYRLCISICLFITRGLLAKNYFLRDQVKSSLP